MCVQLGHSFIVPGFCVCVCVWACGLASIWKQCSVVLWLAYSVLTVCFQLYHSLLVFGSRLKPCVGGPVLSLMTVCFQLGHSLLVLGSSVISNGCVLMAWCQLVYCLLPTWSHFACAWVQLESNCMWACGLVSICSHHAFSLAPVSMCLLSGCLHAASSLVTVCLCLD